MVEPFTPEELADLKMMAERHDLLPGGDERRHNFHYGCVWCRNDKEDDGKEGHSAALRLLATIEDRDQEIARHHKDFARWEAMADKGAQQLAKAKAWDQLQEDPAVALPASLVRRVYGMALFTSCLYATDDNPDVDPFASCCDWNEVVTELGPLIGKSPRQAD